MLLVALTSLTTDPVPQIGLRAVEDISPALSPGSFAFLGRGRSAVGVVMTQGLPEGRCSGSVE
jgi:hypothetical protein